MEEELTENATEESVEQQITDTDVESHPVTIMQFVNECESEPEAEDGDYANASITQEENSLAEDSVQQKQTEEEESHESTKVAEKIIDDSIEKSVAEAEEVLDEEEDSTKEEDDAAMVTESPAEE